MIEDHLFDRMQYTLALACMFAFDRSLHCEIVLVSSQSVSLEVRKIIGLCGTAHTFELFQPHVPLAIKIDDKFLRHVKSFIPFLFITIYLFFTLLSRFR